MVKKVVIGGVVVAGVITLAAGAWVFKDKLSLNKSVDKTIESQQQTYEDKIEMITNTPTETITSTPTEAIITNTPVPLLKEFSMNVYDLSKKLVGKLSFKYPESLKVTTQEQDIKCSKLEPGCLPYYASQAVVSNNKAKLEVGTYKGLEVSCVSLTELKTCRKVGNDLLLVTNKCYEKMPKGAFSYVRILNGNRCGQRKAYVLFLGDIKLGRGILFSNNENGSAINIATKGTITDMSQITRDFDMVAKTVKVSKVQE